MVPSGRGAKRNIFTDAFIYSGRNLYWATAVCIHCIYQRVYTREEDKRAAYFLAFKNLTWRGKGRERGREGWGEREEDIHRKQHRLQTVQASEAGLVGKGSRADHAEALEVALSQVQGVTADRCRSWCHSLPCFTLLLCPEGRVAGHSHAVWTLALWLSSGGEEQA